MAMGNENLTETPQPEAARALPPSPSPAGLPSSNRLVLTQVCWLLPPPSDMLLKAQLKISLEFPRAQGILFCAPTPYILPEPKAEGTPQPGLSLATHTLP